jgi:hypothetical protein
MMVMKVIDGHNLAGRRRDVDLSRALAGSAGPQLATSATAMTKISPSITFITIIGLAEQLAPLAKTHGVTGYDFEARGAGVLTALLLPRGSCGQRDTVKKNCPVLRRQLN